MTDILGMTFDFKMALITSSLVSRAASQWLGILKCQITPGAILSGFCPACFRVLYCSVVLCCRYTP